MIVPKIIVLSKYDVSDYSYKNKNRHIIISIIAKNTEINFKHNNNLMETLRINCNDIDKPLDNCILFNKEHSKAIIEFVNKWKGKVEEIIVHCVAGRSRSPAVAAGIAKLLGCPGETFLKNHAPNMFIYRQMVNAVDGAQI